jgi:hypothetical protein
MGQISDWFCANCFRTVDQLSRHGRCPYCDSNAVDVASRGRRLGSADRSSLPAGYGEDFQPATAVSRRIALAA